MQAEVLLWPRPVENSCNYQAVVFAHILDAVSPKLNVVSLLAIFRIYFEFPSSMHRRNSFRVWGNAGQAKSRFMESRDMEKRFWSTLRPSTPPIHFLLRKSFITTKSAKCSCSYAVERAVLIWIRILVSASPWEKDGNRPRISLSPGLCFPKFCSEHQNMFGARLKID